MKFLKMGFVVGLLVLPVAGQREERRRPGVSSGAAVEVITRTINDCENNTDRFVKNLRRAMKWSALDGTARQDELNRLTKDLERKMDEVGKSWNRKRDVSETRRDVSDAIRIARNVNVTMTRRRLDPDVERDWREVRAQLNLLARAFKLPSISW